MQTKAGTPRFPQPPLVLIVDDDADMRAYLRESLVSLPARVIEAATGAEALHLARDASKESLALVISDLVMPGMDGRALRAAFKADSALSQVPVLFITGESVRARDGPALRKPFNARQLRRFVRSLLPGK